MNINGFNNYVKFSGKNPFGTQSKMLFHLDRVWEYLSTGDTFPIFMEVNPTNRCNLKCYWCISENSRGKEELDIDKFRLFVKDFSKMGGKAITFSGGGEPTIYPYFKDITLYSKEQGLELGLMTNGLFKKELISIIGENYQWVRFSLDTLNRENYRRWKGVDGVSKAMTNINSLLPFPVRVGVNCNVGPELSFREANDLINEFSNKVDYIQFRPVLPRYFKSEEKIVNKTVWRYLFETADLSKVNLSGDKLEDLLTSNLFDFSKCDGHFFEPILDADGSVKVCIYHPRDERFSFGNINQNSLEEIWKSQKRKKTVEFVRKLDYKKNCQACCKLAELNKFLDFISNPQKTKDINFL